MPAATSDAIDPKTGRVGDDHRATGLANRSFDRLEVQRHQRAQVDHLGLDPFLCQRLRDPQGDVDHVGVGHDR